MAASDGSESARGGLKSVLPWAIAIVVLALALVFFPLFHVVPLSAPPVVAPSAAAKNQPVFRTGQPATRLTYATSLKSADPVAKFWRNKLLPAVAQASPAADVLVALQRDPSAASKRYAHQVGIGGTAYYFLRGTGRVVTTDRNQIVVAVDGANGAQVALKVGPLFGNTVRDGTGLLNVNDFPGLAEFNAFSADLNRLIETQVLANARTRARSGATIAFAGCAEAPESVGAGPLLDVVPVEVTAK